MSKYSDGKTCIRNPQGKFQIENLNEHILLNWDLMKSPFFIDFTGFNREVEVPLESANLYTFPKGI